MKTTTAGGEEEEEEEDDLIDEDQLVQQSAAKSGMRTSVSAEAYGKYFRRVFSVFGETVPVLAKRLFYYITTTNQPVPAVSETRRRTSRPQQSIRSRILGPTRQLPFPQPLSPNRQCPLSRRRCGPAHVLVADVLAATPYYCWQEFTIAGTSNPNCWQQFENAAKYISGTRCTAVVVPVGLVDWL